MNKSILSIYLFMSVLLLSSCKKDEPETEMPEPTYETNQSYTLSDVSYGNDAQQTMDVYLPAGRNSSQTKVFVLIHGGGWSSGDKADYTEFFNSLKGLYPTYAIININYRLATSSSPGYPKQINDIEAALAHAQQAKYNLSAQYMLFGASAGGHLSMLYAYAFDTNHQVKAICNTVGPADLTDTAYTNNILLMAVIGGLVGDAVYNYQANESLFIEVSPAKRVTSSSPPTISFYGDADPLVPSSQMPLLHDALDANSVYNEDIMYQGAGHGTWNNEQMQDYVLRIMNFINLHF